MHLFVEWFILLEPSSPVCVTWPLLLTAISDWVFQLTRVMEHGRVVVNMRDQYTDTPYGLNKRAHQNVEFCHLSICHRCHKSWVSMPLACWLNVCLSLMATWMGNVTEMKFWDQWPFVELHHPPTSSSSVGGMGQHSPGHGWQPGDVRALPVYRSAWGWWWTRVIKVCQLGPLTPSLCSSCRYSRTFVLKLMLTLANW